MADATSLRAAITRRAEQARVIAAATVRTELRRAAPYRTGATRESVDVVDFRRRGGRLIATAQATTPQARYTEEGTRPHVIRPRRARALRFRVGNRIVYARRVNHPGTPPRPWFRPTLRDRWGPALRDAWRRAA